MFSLRPLPLPWFHPAFLLATWFGIGRIKPASGTWGSIAAIVIGWPILQELGLIALGVATILVFGLGCWAASRYEIADGGKDPGAVVIDEIAGQWLVLLAVPLQSDRLLLWFLAAFALFRLFDIFKPWPVSWADKRVGGGLGIMLDDIFAGLYGIIGLLALRYLFGVL